MLIPLLFMGDVVGRLFREFAITLAITIVISAVVSLTLVPTLCALWLKRAERGQAHAYGRLNRSWRRASTGSSEPLRRGADLGAGPPGG